MAARQFKKLLFVRGTGVAALAASLLAALPSMAQQAAPGTYTALAVRIGTEEAPSIDADLSDAAWAKATVLDDFRQVEPNAGEPATERTVLRIMYDENNLYFGIYAYDSEPDLVVVRTLARDGNLGTGDFVRIYLDPGMTRRNAYVFEVGPAGARTDALLQNNADLLFEWDTIWQARARRVSDGWVAEAAIPFRSVSYEAGSADWGFDFARMIRRKAERDRWTSHSQTIPSQDISQSGTLTGFAGMTQGLGLDLQAYGRASYKRNWQNTADSAISGAAGANLFYKVTPALTGTLTVNPDFSDSPLDERQVNTTRFSLFTPETRDFFLQDAAAFEFGGRNFLNAQNARPFFSRNIGLIGGQPVSILAGGKLSGEFAGFGIGALSVYTNRTMTTKQQLLSVARITRPVLAESKLGLILTNGSPAGGSKNTVAGADFQYRASNWLGGKTVQSDLYVLRSFSESEGDDNSFGFAFNFPNEPWRGDFRIKQVGRDFAPALGFTNRPGIRNYDGSAGYIWRFRNQYLRFVQFQTNQLLITGLDGRLQSRQSRYWINISNQYADVGNVNLYDYEEVVPAAFLLPRDVEVPAGRYGWTNAVAYVDTTQGRPIVFTWSLECCSFYNGDYFKSDMTIAYRPNEFFEISPRYVAQFIDLPAGSVNIHVLSLNAAANFTADMQLAVQAQFDNISRNFGLSARYRWEYSPGNEIFAALGQTATVPDSNLVAQTTQLSVRLGQTFRF